VSFDGRRTAASVTGSHADDQVTDKSTSR